MWWHLGKTLDELKCVLFDAKFNIIIELARENANAVDGELDKEHIWLSLLG